MPAKASPPTPPDAAPGADAGLAARLAWVQGQLERVPHDVTVRGAGTYEATSIDAIADQVRPLLAKAGVAIVPARVKVLRHEDVVSGSGARGFHVVLLVDWTIIAGDERLTASSTGASIDYSDKAYNKAHTFARKNLLVALLNLSTGSEDPERHSPEAGRAPGLPPEPGAGPPPTAKQAGMARRLARELHEASADRLEVAAEWSVEHLGVADAGDFRDWLLGTGPWAEGIEQPPEPPVDRAQLSRMIDALQQATKPREPAGTEG
jgi:ERF superfamily